MTRSQKDKAAWNAFWKLLKDNQCNIKEEAKSPLDTFAKDLLFSIEEFRKTNPAPEQVASVARIIVATSYYFYS